MPAHFTSSTPLKFIEYDYEKLFVDYEKYFGNLSFFPRWKEYWINVFIEMDKQIVDYTKKFPNSNPVIQRLKHGFVDTDYEIFVYEHITSGGSFYLHFDVEKMKYFQKNNSLSVKTITKEELDIDPETPLIKNRINDKNLPYFIRMYGIVKPYICVDGNKRIQAQINNGQQSFKGYFFDDNILQGMFLGLPDLYYYAFIRECEHMYQLKSENNTTEKEIFELTQMHLLNNHTQKNL